MQTKLRQLEPLNHLKPRPWFDQTTHTKLMSQNVLQTPILKMRKKSKINFHHRKLHASEHVNLPKMAKNHCLKVYFEGWPLTWGNKMKLFSKWVYLWKNLRFTNITANSYTVIMAEMKKSLSCKILNSYWKHTY